jgi:thymidylate kinase
MLTVATGILAASVVLCDRYSISNLLVSRRVAKEVVRGLEAI